MSLVKCSECGKEISDKAVSCPACGNPTHNHVVEDTKSVEVVLTKKRWKKTGLWSILILFAGFIAFSKSIGLGVFLVFVAIVLAFISRIGAWWTNG